MVVRLSGKSAFDGGDLWLELVFELRNGALHDMRVRDHNAFLSPPFASAKSLGQVVAAELSKAGTSRKPTHEKRPSKVTCVLNRTGGTLHYMVRWGEGEWRPHSLEAGWTHYFSIAADQPERFFIDFDRSGREGYQSQRCRLETKISGAPSCETAKQYAFGWSGTTLDLTGLN